MLLDLFDTFPFFVSVQNATHRNRGSCFCLFPHFFRFLTISFMYRGLERKHHTMYNTCMRCKYRHKCTHARWKNVSPKQRENVLPETEAHHVLYNSYALFFCSRAELLNQNHPFFFIRQWKETFLQNFLHFIINLLTKVEKFYYRYT